jgi:hypothetical protein
MHAQHAHVENGPIISEKAEMHHGVHKNLIEHRKGVMDHIRKEREKNMQQQIEAKKQPIPIKGDSGSSDESGEQSGDLHIEEPEEPAGVVVQSPIEVEHAKDPVINPPAQLAESAKTIEVDKSDKEHNEKQPAPMAQGKEIPPDSQRETAKSQQNEGKELKGATIPQHNGDQSLARGYSGLPMDKTPALIGAKRGTVECDVNVEYVSCANHSQLSPSSRACNAVSRLAKPPLP